MSYEIAKAIKLDEKNNRIILTAAANNVTPRHFWTDEIYSNRPTFKEKVIALLIDISGGNIQPNRSLYKFVYAFNRAQKELGVDSFYSVCFPDLPIYYEKENGVAHWNYKGEEYALTAEQITSGEFDPMPYGEQWGRYRKKSDTAEAEQRKQEISERFYSLFMQYYKEKEKSGLYCLDLDGRIIRPVSEYRYQYGYSIYNIMNSERLKKSWTMPYKKAWVLGEAFSANIIQVA